MPKVQSTAKTFEMKYRQKVSKVLDFNSKEIHNLSIKVQF